jgi:peptidoglycan/LPS O-acetylase OafA/YrhL
MIYGRRPRQLLVVWGSALLLVALIYWLEFSAPALHEIVQPFYWMISVGVLFLSWRWFRARSPKDRRGKDRRRTDRRDQTDFTSS